METKSQKPLSDAALLIQDMARGLVDNPENVEVLEVATESCTILEVSVGGEEYGRVIGRGGRLADTMREMTRCIGGRCAHRFILDFVKRDGGTRPLPGERAWSSSEDEAVRRLLIRMVMALVDVPQAVRVESLSGSFATVLEVWVAPEDVRRMIGRQGQTAETLRSYLKSFGAKLGRDILMVIVEPTRHERSALGGAR